MSLAQALVIPDHVMARQVGDETVILDLDSGVYYGLDAVGSRFWQLLAEGGSAASARDRLLEEFDVEPARLDQDLDDLVGQLVASRLLMRA